MRTTILAALAALGLSLGVATSAQAQGLQPYYFYTPQTGYVYGYVHPGTFGYSPYYSASHFYTNPYWAGYYPGFTTQYYNWSWYNPYTAQYRTWQWVR